jgi:Transposase DDE domain group 1/AAA domain, putative AbiEii toxin, Type IV TA system
MRFLIQEGLRPRSVTSYPTAVLRADNWDDYGFKTMFHVRLHLEPGKVLDIETVKILHRDQTGGRTPLPGTSFNSFLYADYCSLGQSYSYYELLHDVGEAVYKPYLEGMCDAVYTPEILKAFKDTDGFTTSLLRFDGAERALEDGGVLFERRAPDAAPAALDFAYRFPGVTTTVTLNVLGGGLLPKRLAVVIGYNGSGKTRLLANLARLTCADRFEAEEEAFIHEVGEFIGRRPQFGSIISVSYSAFDDFAVPEGVGSRATALNYVYCGLRRLKSPAPDEPNLDDPVTASGASFGGTQLKTFEEVADEFHAARARGLQPDRNRLLTSATDTLFNDPSFGTIVELPDILDPGDEWIAAFAALSAGHKIVLNIVVQLCAFMQPRSLVLLDEPELHLHPPLVAAFLRAIGVTLERYNSFAIVATHSPVVLQEVPSPNVTVLRRSFDEINVEQPDSETFAENIGLLTRRVFSLDSSATDYEGTLWNRKLMTRLQSAGWTYSIGVRQQPHIKTAITGIPEQDWQPLADYPEGGEAQIAQTMVGQQRLIVRRTRLVGAQAELWPDWRHHAFLTNRTDPLEQVEAEHRQHAVVELAIRDLKDQALAHFPSGKFLANAAWTVIAALAHNLLRWTTMIGLPDTVIPTARTLRRRLLTVPGRITRTGRQVTLRLPARSPWETAFLSALHRLRTIPTLT